MAGASPVRSESRAQMHPSLMTFRHLVPWACAGGPGSFMVTLAVFFLLLRAAPCH